MYGTERRAETLHRRLTFAFAPLADTSSLEDGKVAKSASSQLAKVACNYSSFDRLLHHGSGKLLHRCVTMDVHLNKKKPECKILILINFG